MTATARQGQVVNIPAPPSSECARCEEKTATVRVVIARLDGTVLDVTEVCLGCVRRPADELGLIVGQS